MNLVGMLGKMLLSNAMRSGRGSGNVLGSLLGGALGGSGGSAAGGQGAGLGGLLAGLAGGGASGSSLGGMLGQLGGAGGQAGQGGLGGLIGSMLGGNASSGGGLGSLLGAAMGQQTPDGGRAAAPSVDAEQNRQAELLIRAMVNAAKADGTVDTQEQEKIVGKLGEVDAEEAAFIRREMSAPLDVDGFVKSVPRGLEQQVYLISLLAIDLDNQAEARYLDALGKGLGIDHTTANQLHEEVGAPALYS